MSINNSSKNILKRCDYGELITADRASVAYDCIFFVHSRQVG
jgi:hypothetical protein